MALSDAFDVISAEDATVARAVAAAKADICATVEMVIEAFGAGGRLIYVGAGTSGRLGVLDAAECPPTFMSDPEMVQGVIAGGWDALRRSIEGAEDRAEDGAAAIDEGNVGPKDVVLGIATGGTTPFVHAALERAKSLGAKTVFFACVSKEHVPDSADVSIRVLTGAEVITGSTRMKAGTATKMVLNMITTLSMLGIGKVYGNLMVDLNAKACAKLRDRAIRILQAVADMDRSRAGELLDRAHGQVKTAIVMHLCGVDQGEAHRRLDLHDGRIGAVLGTRR
jgi:N-acetylmuramic acid 6-phosphate etherase